jgi:DNA-binding LacI/PurR family transcriptional regulator
METAAHCQPPGPHAAARATTLRDVAEATGFHITTISKALRGHPSLPSATRDRIRQAAKELGYESNPVLNALTRARTGEGSVPPAPRIAFVADFRRVGIAGNLSLAYEGAVEQARLLGHEMLLLTLAGQDGELDWIPAFLSQNTVSGLILGPGTRGLARLPMDWKRLAVAQLLERHLEVPSTLVCSDSVKDAWLAHRKLVERGYRRIGLVLGTRGDFSSGTCFELADLAGHLVSPGGSLVPGLLLDGDTPAQMLGAELSAWARTHHLDALIGATLPAAEGFDPAEIARCARCAYVELDLKPEGRGRIAGMECHHSLLGGTAAFAVVSQLCTAGLGLAGRRCVHVPGTWVEGPSAPWRTAERIAS